MTDQNQSATPRYMNAAQAAEYLGIGRSTLYRMCSNREITHLKMGTGKFSAVRFDVRDLDAYARACLIEARTTPGGRR